MGGATAEQLQQDRALVYKVGLVHVSVCCPAGMAVDDVLDQVNGEWPTGLDHGWVIDTVGRFASGAPNPCPCNAVDGRVHRLLVC